MNPLPPPRDAPLTWPRTSGWHVAADATDTTRLVMTRTHHTLNITTHPSAPNPSTAVSELGRPQASNPHIGPRVYNRRVADCRRDRCGSTAVPTSCPATASPPLIWTARRFGRRIYRPDGVPRHAGRNRPAHRHARQRRVVFFLPTATRFSATDCASGVGIGVCTARMFATGRGRPARESADVPLVLRAAVSMHSVPGEAELEDALRPARLHTPSPMPAPHPRAGGRADGWSSGRVEGCGDGRRIDADGGAPHLGWARLNGLEP